jgi:ATP-binding cassette subfamily B protein
MSEVVRLLWPHLRRHRRALALILAAMLGEIVTGLLSPWPLKYVFDSVLFPHHRGTQAQTHFTGHVVELLVLICVAALGIALFDALFSYLDSRISERVAQLAVYELRKQLFTHLQKLSLAYHQNVQTRIGDLLSRLSGDVQALQDLAAGGVSNLTTNGILLVLTLGVMAVLDWPLALVALGLTIPLYVLARRVTTRMRLALRDARRQEGQVSAVLQESLGAIKLVQAFGRERHEEQRLAEASQRSLHANLEAATLQSQLNPLITILSTVATVGVTLVGVMRVFAGAISAGDLLIFLGYVRGMQSPIRQLAKLSYAVGKASAGAERIAETLSREPSVQDVPSAPNLRVTLGRVSFDNVVFGYAPDRPVLRGVSLDVEAGQVVAIVGSTGSGKSTLLSLLPRFYDPWSGAVMIDGQDVATAGLASLRSQVSLVLQDSLIFQASVADNIAYGRPEATRDQIEAAGQAAGVNLLAQRLDRGYDTELSERGTSLSGGEKQCIGIARALLKDAPIVVLDEPTSAMDAFTEKLVMTGVQRLLRGRTGFIIAHRLATIQNADLVAVLRDGQLVEVGTPRELLGRGEIFAELVRTQAYDTAPREALRRHTARHAAPPEINHNLEPAVPTPVREAT